MKYSPKTWGFSQARPKKPGVYFILTDGHVTMHARRCEKECWDVCYVSWENDAFGTDEPTEDGRWVIQTLVGISYTWRKGIYLKGPIDPTVIIQRPAASPDQTELKQP